MKLLKNFVSNKNWRVYLRSFLKFSLSRACVKEAIAFTLLVLWLILVHMFGFRKDKACYQVFSFLLRYIQCYLWFSIIPIVWWRKHIINTKWYHDVPILKNSNCNPRFYSFKNWERIYFPKWIAPMWGWRCRSKQRIMHLFCAA